MSTLSLVLIVSGAALAVLAIARLARVWLRQMPVPIALASLVFGVLGVALGVVLPSLDDVAEPSPEPVVSLEPAPAASAAPVLGRIDGTVLGADHKPVAGRTVTLLRFRGTQREASTDKTTASDGAFAFGDLPIAPTTAYVVSTTFEGTEFRSDLIVLDPDAPLRTAPLVVAAATSDPSALSVAVDSTAIVGDEKGAQVLQVMRVENASPKAFTGGLDLPLLDRATGFTPGEGLDRTQLRLAEDGTLRSLSPVIPGTTEILYTYAVPVPRSGLQIRREFAVPTKRFELLVGGELRTLQSEGTKPEGNVVIAGRRYIRSAATNVGPSDTIRANAELPGPSRTLQLLLIGAGVAAAVALIAVPLMRRRRPPATPQASAPEPAVSER